jgi:hypothetical protein
VRLGFVLAGGGRRFGGSCFPISSEHDHAPFNVSITPGTFVVLLVSLSLGSILPTLVSSLNVSQMNSLASALN